MTGLVPTGRGVRLARERDTGADRPEAAPHARLIVGLVSTLVPPSNLQQLRNQLPESDDENWRTLFAVIDDGGWGDAQEAQTGGGPQPLGESGRESAGGWRELTRVVRVTGQEQLLSVRRAPR